MRLGRAVVDWRRFEKILAALSIPVRKVTSKVTPSSRQVPTAPFQSSDQSIRQ